MDNASSSYKVIKKKSNVAADHTAAVMNDFSLRRCHIDNGLNLAANMGAIQKTRKKGRPWLTPTLIPIPTLELKEVVKTWDIGTWEAYLKWYERPLRARLLIPGIYDKLADDSSDTIFEEFNQSSKPTKRNLCERLLRKLPWVEAEVLRLTFLAGQAQRQIGAILKRSQTNISQIKIRALQRLKRGRTGDGMFTREFMRGESSKTTQSALSIWSESLSLPIKEAKVYAPDRCEPELQAIRNSVLNRAINVLTKRQQTAIYLRFWCDYRFEQIAYYIVCGVNTVDQILDASVSKIKQQAITDETTETEGGSSCT